MNNDQATEPYPDRQSLRAMAYALCRSTDEKEIECQVDGKWTALTNTGGISYYIAHGYRLRIKPEWDNAAARGLPPELTIGQTLAGIHAQPTPSDSRAADQVAFKQWNDDVFKTKLAADADTWYYSDPHKEDAWHAALVYARAQARTSPGEKWTEDEIRKRFEQTKASSWINLERYNDGAYKDSFIQLQWNGFLAGVRAAQNAGEGRKP